MKLIIYKIPGGKIIREMKGCEYKGCENHFTRIIFYNILLYLHPYLYNDQENGIGVVKNKYAKVTGVQLI